MKFFCPLYNYCRMNKHKPYYRCFPTIISLWLGFSLCLLFSSTTLAQELPGEIRGYKVYQEKIVIRQAEEQKKTDGDLGVVVNFEDPELTDFSLLGITFELRGDVTVYGQSGTVDFITFKDFKVNGVEVEVEEYREPFDFKKGKPFKLEKPVEIFVNAAQTLRGALKETKDSQDEWVVTGQVFVFGRFKKAGFKFKRVVPVYVVLKIKNPLKTS